MRSRHGSRPFVAALLLTGVMAASAVISAPVAGAATAANRNYVRALYSDLLDRPNPPDNDGGIDYWANQLETRSRTQVARGLQYSSTEYFGSIVDIAYAIYLDRAADPSGRASLVNKWRDRSITYERAIGILVGSNEYFRKSGSTNGGFVDKAYADILGSEPSKSARNFFVGVAASRGREAVGVILAVSDQARTAIIRYEYGSFLGRTADAATVNFWLNRMKNGLRREDFDLTLLASSEYYRNNS